MLGLRAAPRSDTGVSAAELTFGRTLRLPGEYFDSSKRCINDEEYVTRLKETIGNLKSKSFIHRDSKTFFVHPDLSTCTKVFVRNDIVKKSLQSPYEGPYPIVKRLGKTFVIQLNNRLSNISIDRLKPAYLPSFEHSEAQGNFHKTSDVPKNTTTKVKKVRFQDVSGNSNPTQTKTTRSGRLIKPPRRFVL
ncbi:Uncharacterized protein OBRU01_04406 [Operophtera brumata]|uniref:Uncharacterized protein n=1 Tax=Operophtera brumata TaxID=104452 RepID=A0A0L7LKK2_OPEBR|nr:Uncharacterized protein OBRU01_04406 [Operophtera brumata]